MISFKKFLLESFEEKPEHTFKGRSYKIDKNLYHYAFDSKKGVGEVWITHPKKKKNIDVSFTIDGEHVAEKPSSVENALHILNSVVGAVRHHGTKRKFDTISYSSSPQKSRIFDKMIKKLGKTPARRRPNTLL